MLLRSLYFVPLSLMMFDVASVTGQSPFTCPARGDEIFGSKADLDALNDVACNMTNTAAFTSILTDSAGSSTCTTYCASCEFGICDLSFGDEPAVTCSDPSKCTMCDEPLGCSTGGTDGTSSARKTAVATVVAALAVVAVTMLY
jgi:hypothetical protein